jgi:hypothetical protein
MTPVWFNHDAKQCYKILLLFVDLGLTLIGLKTSRTQCFCAFVCACEEEAAICDWLIHIFDSPFLVVFHSAVDWAHQCADSTIEVAVASVEESDNQNDDSEIVASK